MLDDHDATLMWRQLFHGQEITEEILAKAKALLDGLSSESPLRIRFGTELEEIRTISEKKRLRAGPAGLLPKN